MITGYFIRGGGDSWALIRMDESYAEEVVLDGIPYERAVRLYWRHMLKLKREQKQTRQPEPTLFPLLDDARPVSQRKADGRYREPLLFDELP